MIELENQAGLARVTCGWKLPHLSLEAVRPYWRDAHSPGIARRPGIHEYRHYPLDPVVPGLFGPLPDIATTCPPDEMLMWLSDVRYRDEAAAAEFAASPRPDIRAQMLADIDMIVDRSTTYRVVGDNARTLRDDTGDAAPAGPAASPTFEIFFRTQADQPTFRAALRELAQDWASAEGVRRVRLAMFETPDMEAERSAGYPVKTHPQAQQYQAWIDLVVQDKSLCAGLVPQGTASWLHTIHAYPAPAVYTFNQGGRPTLAGLRGYPATAAIRGLGARHQTDPGLLGWMYGPVAGGVTA